MAEQTRETRFYVARVNMQTGVEEVVHQEEYNKLYRTTNNLNTSNGFNEPADANTIVNAMNNINDQLGQEYYYFTKRRDEVTTRILNNAPQEVIDLLQPTEEVTEEPPVDEGTGDTTT